MGAAGALAPLLFPNVGASTLNFKHSDTKTLSEIIQEKLPEKRTEIDTQYTDAEVFSKEK